MCEIGVASTRWGMAMIAARLVLLVVAETTQVRILVTAIAVILCHGKPSIFTIDK